MKTIEITQLPETKTYTDRFKRYTATYPNGYPVHVRRVWNCSDCGVEVGGHFGNKVYGDHSKGLCAACVDKDDPIVQMCIAQTGMTPSAYQTKWGHAWDE